MLSVFHSNSRNDDVGIQRQGAQTMQSFACYSHRRSLRDRCCAHIQPLSVRPAGLKGVRRDNACSSTDRSQPEDAQESSKSERSKKLALPAFLRPLTDFGIGKKSVWEGGVGLFVLAGAGVAWCDPPWALCELQKCEMSVFCS